MSLVVIFSYRLDRVRKLVHCFLKSLFLVLRVLALCRWYCQGPQAFWTGALWLSCLYTQLCRVFHFETGSHTVAQGSLDLPV